MPLNIDQCQRLLLETDPFQSVLEAVRPACRVTAWAQVGQQSPWSLSGVAEGRLPEGLVRVVAVLSLSSRECHLSVMAVASLGLSECPGGSSCISFSGGTPEMMLLV